MFGQMANKYAGDISIAMAGGLTAKRKPRFGLGSEAFGQLVDDYLNSHPTLDPSEKAAITQWAAAISGAAIGGMVAGNNSAQSGAAASLDAERYNRQLHPNERAEIKKLAEGDEETGFSFKRHLTYT